MTSINAGLWRAAQNTRIPALNHVLSYRVSGLNPTGGAQTFQFPSSAGNPAQVVTAYPIVRDAEPQQGLKIYVQELIVRDANGTLNATGGTAAGSAFSVALIDQSPVNGVTSNTPVAASATGNGNVVITATLPNTFGQSAAQATPAYYTTVVGTAGNAAGLVVINAYDQLALIITPATAGTGQTAPTATAFSVDVLATYQQAV
jgi:hypothetical protein